jgi:hypothetical protein
MRKFVARRVDDMLTAYGDKHVMTARHDAEKCCETLSATREELARHAGESLAWAVHDSFFIWERPLSNPFTELRDYMCQSDCEYRARTVLTWADLKQYTLQRAVGFLNRMSYPPLPAMLTDEHEKRWWIMMAILHQCYRQLREIV